MKQIAILGSTGSIGCNTLRVVDALKGGFGVAALGAGSNVELLARQVEQYRPRVVSAGDEEGAEKLRHELKEPASCHMTGPVGQPYRCSACILLEIDRMDRGWRHNEGGLLPSSCCAAFGFRQVQINAEAH